MTDVRMQADVDPLLVVWGRTLRYLRRGVNADGDKLGDEDEPMTQEQLGLELDPPVRQSTVARWESGEREPKRRYKAQIATLFGLPQEVIFVASVERVVLPLADPSTSRRERKAVA